MLSIFPEKELYLWQLERKINNFERFSMLSEKFVIVIYIKTIVLIIFKWTDEYICVSVFNHMIEKKKNTAKIWLESL